MKHLCALACLLSSLAHGQLVVTTAIDEDNGNASPGNGTGTSLREAVKYAQATDTITFAPAFSGQTIAVTNGLISITRSVTIDASDLPAGVILNAHGRNSLFHCGSQTTNQFIRLTLTGGRTAFGGGAILNDSLLTLNDCLLAGNVANEGGAIFQFTDVTLNNCTVASNYARFAGGIENDGGTLTLNNSTIARNFATNEAGGILNFFTLIMSNSTVTANQASAGGGIVEDGISALLVHNSIIAGNTAPFAPNLSGDIDSSSGVNLTSGNPMLSPLGSYGGPTPTMPPLPGSPAIDPVGGRTNSLFATDQRGLPRVVNGIMDVGAVEVQLLSIVPIRITDPEMLGNGTFRFGFTNLTGATFQVLATTNAALPASDWPSIGPATETPPGSGQFQFTDPSATNRPHRFYRVKPE